MGGRVADVTSRDRAAADRIRFDEWVRYARESGEVPALPAATVVVLRDTDEGLQTLMLRKNSNIAFGGMWVFPGGRIDDEDWAGVKDDVSAARVAAVREAREEANLVVDPDALVLMAHWIPPSIAPKRFATWFFAARAGTEQVQIDDGEIVDMEWMTPANCLQRHHQGEIELVPPTWVTLHTISTFDTVDTALAELDARPPRHHATRASKTERGLVVMWQGDVSFESGNVDLEGPRHRLEMFEDGYHYLDSGAV